MSHTSMSRSHPAHLAGLALCLSLALTATAVSAQESAGERYAGILREADGLAQYNEQLNRQIQAQAEQLALLEQQLAQIDTTGSEIGALIQKMYDQFEQFIAGDLPFKDPLQDGEDTRAARIERIRGLMQNESASSAEKYRRLMEAYQIELEYGRNLVAYKGTLEDGRGADFVRLGRISLMYRTEDGEEAGYWDSQQKQWVVENDYERLIERAVNIATKLVAPDLVVLPVPAPTEVRS